MSNIKKFIKTKRGKSILFFGFYLVFFVILAILMKNNINKETIQDNKKLQNNLWTINRVINLDDYLYKVEINDNGNTEIKYEARKNELSNDLEKNEMDYFLDIYNINKLIKNSKLIESLDNKTTYMITNTKLNEILSEMQEDGENIIIVENSNKSLSIQMDLHEFMKKNEYIIKIEYRGVDSE